jgi:hypothetical protein
MLAIVDSFEPLGGDIPSVTTKAESVNRRSLQWRSRYDGLVSVAYIDGKAVAGISGPWSGKYALTWWERPMPARELELHDSLGAAQREVEEWALRMHSGDYALPLPEAFTQALPLSVQRQRAANAAARKAGLFERMRSLLPQLRPSSSEKIDRLRLASANAEPDLRGLHFAATD